MFKGITDFASMLKQAQEMGGKMKDFSDQMRNQRVSGNAGGGMVEAEVNGLGEVIRVKIDPQLVTRGDREMIEDLIPAAINQAVAKSQELRMKAMQSMTGELNVPGLQEALSKFTGR